MNFQKAIDIFNNYVETFDKSTYKLDVKYNHSYRVVKYAEEIACSLNLDDYDFYLAQVCALFHDVSRFRQGKEFGTFDDFVSFDHGDVSAEILIENGFIDQLVNNDEDKNIILKAVKNHNKYQIEDGLTEKELLFAKIVRDADKIDIMDTQKNEIKDGSTKVDEDVYEYIKNRKLFKKKKGYDEYDNYSRICMQISFVFDLYFQKSFEILDENGILRKKLDIINNEEIENIVHSFIIEKMRMF